MTGAPASTGETLWELVEAGARRFGPMPAVKDETSRPRGPLSFDDLRRAGRSTASGLGELGIRRGDAVALWLPNWSEWLLVEVAAAYLGATVLALNTRFRRHELSHLLALARPKVVVRPAAFLGIAFDGLLSAALADLDAAGATLAPAVVLVGGHDSGETCAGIEGGGIPFDDLTARRRDADPRYELGRPEDTLNCFTTSGSTGLPKLAAHSQGSLARHSRAVARAFSMQPGDALLGNLPLCGAFGLTAALAALAGGASVLLEPRHDPARTSRLIADGCVSHLFCGDDVLAEVCDRAPEGGHLGRLRSGGVADFTGRAGALIREAEERFEARLTGLYGSSECLAMAAAWPPETDLRWRSRCGGRPVDEAIEWRVADSGSGPVQRPDGRPGRTGELRFRGYNVLTGYLNDELATERAFADDGWFCSGDLGFAAEDGFVFVSRRTPLARVSGFLVDPEEVASFLRAQPCVAGAWVVATRGPGSDSLVAFVRPADLDACSEEALLAACRSDLGSFKVPSRVVLVDELPMTAGTNGAKVDLVCLQRMAAAELLGEADRRREIDSTMP